MKDIFIFNAMTEKSELFKPLKKNNVTMYVCGPTVYNYPHLGNLRPAIVFDTLRRLFIHEGYQVEYVTNYTDIDDRIIEAAIKEHKTEKQITDYYINEYEQMLKELNILPPSFAPRVTEYIPIIVDYIAMLMDFGYAYEKNGNVYFRVDKDKTYGELSKIKLDELKVGARIAKSEDKESDFDFVLWKKTDKGLKWEAPFGAGRPGWHTECVVMINEIFNHKMIDIHGGGLDLKFPHHENELAQCRVIEHRPLANYWMYNGFLNIDNHKMSKSLNNVIRGDLFLSQYGGLLTRYLFLKNHYRSPMNIGEEIIKTAEVELNRIVETYHSLSIYLAYQQQPFDGHPNFIEAVIKELRNDLGTPNALSELFQIIKNINQILRGNSKDLKVLKDYHQSLTHIFMVLGLDILPPNLSNEDFNDIAAFIVAKKMKNFVQSDLLRTKLSKHRINIGAVNFD